MNDSVHNGVILQFTDERELYPMGHARSRTLIAASSLVTRREP